MSKERRPHWDEGVPARPFAKKGKWRSFLESCVAMPGTWGRIPFPVWTMTSAKQYASNIRKGVALSGPVRDLHGRAIMPEDGHFEAQFYYLGDDDPEKPYWTIYARWIPASKPQQKKGAKK